MPAPAADRYMDLNTPLPSQLTPEAVQYFRGLQESYIQNTINKETIERAFQELVVRVIPLFAQNNISNDASMATNMQDIQAQLKQDREYAQEPWKRSFDTHRKQMDSILKMYHDDIAANGLEAVIQKLRDKCFETFKERIPTTTTMIMAGLLLRTDNAVDNLLFFVHILLHITTRDSMEIYNWAMFATMNAARQSITGPRMHQIKHPLFLDQQTWLNDLMAEQEMEQMAGGGPINAKKRSFPLLYEPLSNKYTHFGGGYIPVYVEGNPEPQAKADTTQLENTVLNFVNPVIDRVAQLEKEVKESSKNQNHFSQPWNRGGRGGRGRGGRGNRGRGGRGFYQGYGVPMDDDVDHVRQLENPKNEYGPERGE